MITASVNRIIYNGNGQTTEFPYSFAIINADDVKVMTIDPDNKETVLDSDYYVDTQAKKVIYPGYPPGQDAGESEKPPILPAGWKLVVYREVPITQESKLSDVWPFNVIEAGLDKLTMICQVIKDDISRCFIVGPATPLDVDTTIPWEAGKGFRISDDGKKIEVTEDPAKVTPQVEALLSQTKQQANIATQQATAAAESALSAADSETNADTAMTQARNSAVLSQKWAESSDSPDGQKDTDSPTGDTMSSKEWALYAKKLAEEIGNPVVEVTEDNGTVNVEKSDGSKSSFKAGINIIQRKKSYKVGDIAYAHNLPSWAYLSCVSAGSTAAEEPSFGDVTAMGKYITDGSVKWIVEDIRFNVPVGVVFYDSYLHNGCVKFNGATVNRADYVRLEKLANDKNLWTDDPSTEPYKYGRGDGSTTMVLPDFRNVFIEGGDTPVKVEAGIPTFTGMIGNIFYFGSTTGPASQSGALTGNKISDIASLASGNPASCSGTLSIDPSQSNSVYGNSDTIQPPAIVLIPQMKY